MEEDKLDFDRLLKRMGTITKSILSRSMENERTPNAA